MIVMGALPKKLRKTPMRLPFTPSAFRNFV